MSDEILTPPDLLRWDCGRPYSEHTFDADVVDEAQERVEFDQAVARRVEEKLVHERLVQYKMAQAHGDTSVPRPRDSDGDKLEVARIVAYENAKSYRQLVDRKVQHLKAGRGDAEYITDPGAPSREAWAAGLRKSVDVPDRRDATDIEYRNCIPGA
jgi:hypothetical protein